MPRRLCWSAVALATVAILGAADQRAHAFEARAVAGSPSVARQQRLQQIGRRIAPASGLTFAISRRGGLGAWSWPAGRIELTAALVDVLDDDEVAAAIAHERAHLATHASEAKRPAALAGASAGETMEMDADRAGCAILRDHGIPPEAMVRMLRKVSAGLRDPGRMTARIVAATACCTP